MSRDASLSEVMLAHSSDVHVDNGKGISWLNAVLGAARAVNADIVLLAGDTFENNGPGLWCGTGPIRWRRWWGCWG